MKKAIAIACALAFTATMLSACYSTSCPADAPVYKDSKATTKAKAK